MKTCWKSIPKTLSLLWLLAAMTGTSFAEKERYLNLGVYAGSSSGSNEAFTEHFGGRWSNEFSTRGLLLGGYLNVEVAPKWSMQLDFSRQGIKNDWYVSSTQGTDSGSLSTLVLSGVVNMAQGKTVIFYIQGGGGVAFSSNDGIDNLNLAAFCLHFGSGLKINLSPKDPLVRLTISAGFTTVPGKGSNYTADLTRIQAGLEFHLRTDPRK